ncbi:MAG: ribose transport system permease protein [Thermoleophilaceae bacterium]|jgi:ribose transport system permease protein|nr:ribose transport system permease protein [Thermoleophilaceae bacterium]
MRSDAAAADRLGASKLPFRVPGGLRGNWMPLAILVLLVAITGLVSPEFFQVTNLLNVARQASIVGVIAVGMTFVILTGGIDLSVGSILAISAVVMAIMAEAGYPLIAILPTVIALATLVGVFNGCGVALFGIQPFIMTLATLVIGRGVALRITDGGPQEFFLPNGVVDFLGSGGIGRIPGPLIVFAVLALIGWAVLRHLSFGRFLYAIGGSQEAARLSGVRTKRNLIGAYAVSGACAGIAGIMTASRLSVGDPTAGNLAELDAIAAVVIGGTSLMGGVGGMPGTVAGALLLAVVANLLNLAGVSPFDQQIVKGVVILAAVLLAGQALRSRSKAARRTPEGAEGEGTSWSKAEEET